MSQGTRGSFSYPFPGHLDAATTWLGNTTSMPLAKMGTSDPLPGSLCTQISPLGVPQNSGLSTKVPCATEEKRREKQGTYLEVLSFKNYIRNLQNVYMTLSYLH